MIKDFSLRMKGRAQQSADEQILCHVELRYLVGRKSFTVESGPRELGRLSIVFNIQATGTFVCSTEPNGNTMRTWWSAGPAIEGDLAKPGRMKPETGPSVMPLHIESKRASNVAFQV